MANKRGRGRRNGDNLVALAIESSWKINLALCLGSLLVNGIFHSLFKSNTFAPVLFVISDMATGSLALLCGSLAIIKFIYSQLQARRARRVAHSSRQPIEPALGQNWRSLHPAHPAHPAPRVPATAMPLSIGQEPGLARPEVHLHKEWAPDVLHDMEWKRFEEICLAFYRAKGIRAESTPLGPDGGVDIRLYQDAQAPERCTAVVQCKAWGDKYVGVAPVRELRGVMAHERIEKAFFMAPGAYSDEAKAFARDNRITLIDGTLFLVMLKRLEPEVSRQLLKQATAGDWTTPSCPRCGTKMRAREGQNGSFWGCGAYPKCRQKLGMRKGQE